MEHLCPSDLLTATISPRLADDAPGSLDPFPPRRGVSVGRHGAPSPRWWRRGFTALYQDGGGRLPARASPIRDPDRGGQAEAAALGVRERRERLQSRARPPARPPARPLDGVAAASALVTSAKCCHLWGHQSYFPAPQGHSAAPRPVSPRPQGPRVAPACPALPGGHHYPRPVPLSVLGGPATCFSGRPGGAYGNSWRELNADVGGLWSCVFCLIGGRAAGVPGTLRAGQRTQLGAANVTTRGEGSRRGAWMRAPKGVEGEVRSLG